MVLSGACGVMYVCSSECLKIHLHKQMAEVQSQTSFITLEEEKSRHRKAWVPGIHLVLEIRAVEVW